MTEFQLTPSSAVPQSPPRISAGAIIARTVLGLLAATALLIVGIFVALPFLASAFQLKAFRFPSDSMCPTICIHENFVVSMNAYRRYPPKRGDVVLHLMPNNRAPYVNRVIAIAGDTVSFGSHNEILVNDVPVTFPPVCGRPVLPDQAGSESHAFQTVKVAENHLFVIGDNLSSSYDSRLYGPIEVARVTGKPLFLYWSPGTSRLGCPVR